MYVTETGGHKVAPAPASTRLKKVVDYNKSMNHQHYHQQQQQHHHHHHHQHRHEGGGDRGGGGTHIAATVKNTVRRLLRRTKSHRDTPSTNASTMTAVVANGHVAVPSPTRIPTSRNDTCNAPPPSSDIYRRRYSRARARPQVSEKANERSLL
ncbi:map microtubule affinity-regulating kinase 3 isoform x12 [Lasius niger]|uniref:Map microtubule affinity-regulating kinase 3 isoform x12 n=1 Tax=Lasius niger TaxID=67767 RepID=A0A0J7LB47_LASNI|nr:map microtubule affinity-regulating kinase 3 isoform x12 [Lasius niger]